MTSPDKLFEASLRIIVPMSSCDYPRAGQNIHEIHAGQSMQPSEDQPGSGHTFRKSRESHYCSAWHSRATSTQVCSLSSVRAFLICHFQYRAPRRFWYCETRCESDGRIPSAPLFSTVASSDVWTEVEQFGDNEFWQTCNRITINMELGY